MRVNDSTTDYLVIGAGAAGMAFADTLLDETDAHITLVDRQAKPGGHWNDAYPFVTLHQPSAFYGVNSTPLGQQRCDEVGLNRGLYELATGAEVCAYFDRVMQQRLLPSGRVRYLPMSRHLGGGRVESILSGEQQQITVRRKLVDATYLSPQVPATHRPRFEVAPGVQVVPPNALPLLSRADGNDRPRHFVILGAGKTAMDTAVWLLQSGARPEALQWVVPRDSWLINRLTTQPGEAFFDTTIGSQAMQMEALATATSVPDLFHRLESCGALLRIHPDHEPSMFHLATISTGEVEVLRRIEQVVRLGRVTRIEPHRLLLQHGEWPVQPQTLFVDCTASAVEPRPLQPFFQGDRIVLQICRLPQPAFSAALAAYVEAHGDDDRQKNRLCASVPFPHTLEDYPKAMFAHLWNQAQWAQDKPLRQWIRNSRLDGFGKLVASVDPSDAARQALLVRLKQQAMAAMVNLPRLIAAG